jgi:hypothetical protein
MPAIHYRKHFTFHVLFSLRLPHPIPEPISSLHLLRCPHLLLPVPPPISPSMEVIDDDEIDETERVEDGGDIPTKIGINLSSQSSSSRIPVPSIGRGSSPLLRTSFPRPSGGSGRGRRGAVGWGTAGVGVVGRGTASRGFVGMGATGGGATVLLASSSAAPSGLGTAGLGAAC